jgi:hypothetical protein
MTDETTKTETDTRLARYRAVEREADTFGRIIGVRRLRPSEKTKLMSFTADVTGSDMIDEIVDETVPALDLNGNPVLDDEGNPVLEKTGNRVKTGNKLEMSHRLPLMIVASVCEVDKFRVQFPRSRQELDGTYDTLDDEGLAAASRAFARLVANDSREEVFQQSKSLAEDESFQNGVVAGAK